MTRRIQCGGASLEIDPLTGELTLEDFLNTVPPPHMEPMQTPKVELGSSFGVFGIPFLDNLLGDIYGQLDLIVADMEKFIETLEKKTKELINWRLALMGVTTISAAIPIITREIANLAFRWKAFHQWEKEQKKENQPQDIPDEEIEKKEEISELSGEDQEPPSLGEVEEPLLDDEGNPVHNPDGTPATTVRVFALPRDISDDYDPIPEPGDLTDEELTPEEEEKEEDKELIKVDDDLIKKLVEEFDPQVMSNEDNLEYLLEDGVFILHIKNIVMKRQCIPPGDRVGFECKMLKSIIEPELRKRYSNTFVIRHPNCDRKKGDMPCCSCYPFAQFTEVFKVRTIKRDQFIWWGNACECGQHCKCRCHWEDDIAVTETTFYCDKEVSYGPIGRLRYSYSSKCIFFSSDIIDKRGQLFKYLNNCIIRYEDEQVDWPSHTREICDFCKVMDKYYNKTKWFKYHKSNTDAYIFFSRGEKSTLFQKCKDLLYGTATNWQGDLLAWWDKPSLGHENEKILEYRGITCKCDVARPMCVHIYTGWASEAHTNAVAYLQGHAQRVKYIYSPDFTEEAGDPWWYNDPHDYQSIKKICIFEGYLEHGTPDHVIRFYTYRKLTDRDWFPRLYEKIRKAVLREYPDVPQGLGELAKRIQDFYSWREIDRLLSDVVPVPEIYPELASPEKPLFAARPDGWTVARTYTDNWPEALQPVRDYMRLLDKYYPGWRAFRDTHEGDWWEGFWAQIPDMAGIERTTIFHVDDLQFIPQTYEIRGEPGWWRGFWGPTIRDNMPDPGRPRTYKEVLAVCNRY